jgi:predicted pyridoxine 5'-phosphate oxidase superfamily flavin-nucleotide-binding protein
MVIIARVSPSGEPWAGLVAGHAGFLSVSSDLEALGIAVSDASAARASGGMLDKLAQGEPLGLLLIELSTRRRLRINGEVASLDGSGLVLSVSESFALCPKYIQRRDLVERASPSAAAKSETGTGLNNMVLDWVRSADTCFVASAHPSGRLDASHRGGQPGFVQVRDGALLVPDYPGNSMFNTLGNFAANPVAGLCFVDFNGARQLQLTGDVLIRYDVAEDNPLTGGTGRWWEVRPRRWVVSTFDAPFGFQFIDASSFNP